MTIGSYFRMYLEVAVRYEVPHFVNYWATRTGCTVDLDFVPVRTWSAHVAAFVAKFLIRRRINRLEAIR